MLVSRMALRPEATVLDLAAGNGRLTRPLTERFARVLAVEPHAGMRAALEARAPAADIRPGTAEQIPLGAESVDAVFVGSAFHWFDATRALPEIARVLRPRGPLGMVAGRWARDTSDWAREVDRVLGRHGSNPAAGWTEPFDVTDLFAPLEHALVVQVEDDDRAGILARVASISFIAALPDDERREVLGEVGRILDAHGVGIAGEAVPTTHRIELSWTRRL
ncbi:MAG TPA: class I SAM-dependent methyltransferase [Solirubrobacterales bacterium]|nr:class I SAM-dependent methyltransferase [Solirubrobacterales bacterium]